MTRVIIRFYNYYGSMMIKLLIFFRPFTYEVLAWHGDSVIFIRILSFLHHSRHFRMVEKYAIVALSGLKSTSISFYSILSRNFGLFIILDD